jgi:hypothetical protein
MNQNTMQNFQNPNPGLGRPTTNLMNEYLQNQRPSVIRGENNEPVIIPPLNTDIRFTQNDQQYRSLRRTENKRK